MKLGTFAYPTRHFGEEKLLHESLVLPPLIKHAFRLEMNLQGTDIGPYQKMSQELWSPLFFHGTYPSFGINVPIRQSESHAYIQVH